MRRWPGLEMDDAIQIGREALCQAAIDWKPGAGPFPSFAYMRVYFRIIDWLRVDGPSDRFGKKRPKTISWVDDSSTRPYDYYEDRGPPTETILRSQDLMQDHADVVAGREWFMECMKLVNPRERWVLSQVLLKGRTHRSLAREMGVSEGRVSQLASRALDKIRRSHVVTDAYG